MMLVVFGGSFNPPTIAHYNIAKHILKNLDCRHFFFLPVGDQYPKKELIEAKFRVDMLKLLCAKLERTSVSTLEVEADHVLTSFETLSLFRQQYPNDDIGFVIGADNLKDLPNWVQADELIRYFKIIVFRRDDIDVDDLIQTLFKEQIERFIVLDSFGEMDVSSTQYRQDVKNDKLVLQEVDAYVHAHHLYGRGETK